jgi:glycosyltransferase involved in cell wall biosynthesis
MCALLCAADRNTVVYLNSFFGRRHSMLAILMRWLGISRPRCLVLAPRGEFSPGAMRFKRRRKSLYISISRWFGLHRGIVWHASSNFEAEDIIRHFPQTSEINLAGPICELEGATRAAGRNETIVASDIAGTELPVRRDGRLKKPGQLSAVFISRLSRKKNLAGALRMLKGVPGDVSFDIYGPAEDPEYWSECQGLIAALPPNIRVRYEGEIKHERVREVFAHHDLFLFPTLGENFGHVISEALLAGCPVLTSDQTPWRNLEAEGVGWDLPLCETERFRSVLQQCVDSDSEWLAALSSCAAKYAAKLASDPQSVNAHRKLFQRAHAWPNSPRSTMAL